jgi:pimeloyl-ACP methyl ester carboxylesterase
VNLRRAYFDCRYGQLHARTAFPNTGGFDERTPLVLLHDAAGSSRTFAPLLPILGTDRSLYAADTPGCGESDPAPPSASLADHAAAICDLLDGLRLREVDLLGYDAGSAIAAEVAIARPRQVRRVAFVGLPVPAVAERTASAPQARPAAGDVVYWAAAERLPLVTQPALVLRPTDDLSDHAARGRGLLPQARWRYLPELGARPFETAPQVLASELRAFLDAP